MRGLKIGICEYLMRDLDPEIARAVEGAIAVFRRANAWVTEVKIPELDGNPDAAGLITLAEAIAYYHPYIEKAETAGRSDGQTVGSSTGLGPKVLERLKRAYDISARDLVLAHRQRLATIAALERTFESVSVLVGATLPAFPPVIGTGEVQIGGRTEPVLREFPRLTSLANFAGLPALSVPCGFSKAGLPIGFQFVGPENGDEALLAMGTFVQRDTDWHRRWPPEAEA